MIGLKIIVAASMVVASVLTEGVLGDNFSQINKYLLKKEPASWDLEANMKAASEMYTKEKNKKSSMCSFMGSNLKPLEQFTALRRVLDPDVRCTKESVDILKANNEATKGRAVGDTYHERSRVEEVIQHAAMDHAKLCYNVYPLRWVERVGQMNAMVVHRARIYGSEMLKEIKNSIKLFSRQGIPLPPFFSNYWAKAVHDQWTLDQSVQAGVVRQAMSDSRKFDFAPVSHGIEQDFQRYIVEPCEELSNEGRAVFDLAIFDAKSYVDTEQEIYREYYLDWAYSRICERLIRTKNQMLEAIK